MNFCVIWTELRNEKFSIFFSNYYLNIYMIFRMNLRNFQGAFDRENLLTERGFSNVFFCRLDRLDHRNRINGGCVFYFLKREIEIPVSKLCE